MQIGINKINEFRQNNLIKKYGPQQNYDSNYFENNLLSKSEYNKLQSSYKKLLDIKIPT